jgi:CheY-like chemotaxis protein
MDVLVTEDQPVSRLMLEEWLETWGHQAILATDGVEAWDILNSGTLEQPCLLILDWMMPRMDGLELCRRIRADAYLSQAYIIMLTAKNTQEDLQKALQVGVDDFISKPVQPEELHSRLQAAEQLLFGQEEWFE